MRKANGLVFVGVLSVFLVGIGAAKAQESAQESAQEQGPQARVARLIRGLGSRSYVQRQHATTELELLGPESRGQIEEAAKSKDPEIRLRAMALLQRLKEEAIWAARRVTLNCQGEQAGEVLKQLSEQTGNHLQLGNHFRTFHAAAVDVSCQGVRFWEVLDDVCRQSGNHVQPQYDQNEHSMLLVTGAPGRYPTAYSGPLRAEITSARRAFIEELDYEDGESDVTHTFQLNLRLMWEERFRLVAYHAEPEVLEALTDTDVQLSWPRRTDDSWATSGRGSRQVTAELRLDPPPTSASKLAILRLGWRLSAVGDMATLDVENLERGRPHSQDDVELRVLEVEERPGKRWEITLLVNREHNATDPRDAASSENEIRVLDEEGRLLRMQGKSWSLTDDGLKLRATFSAEANNSRPRSLRFTYPRIRTQRDLQIVFRDVPLPTARPKE